jgi:hypothetical protein
MSPRSYNPNSKWNDPAELKCLYVFKVLHEEGFPRGKQLKMCIELSEETGLSAGNLSAKVGNFKSVAGINNPSNASENTKSIFIEYGNLTSKELEKIIGKYVL